jgi:M6 family metalloprotease-like protein
VIVFVPPSAAFSGGWATIGGWATEFGPLDGFARADGRWLGFGVTFGNNMYADGVPDVREATSSLVRELLHTFGLPDLYRYGRDSETFLMDMGAWDPMSWYLPGFGLTAWHLRKLGWLPARHVTCLERRHSQRPRRITATLRPLGTGLGRQALIIPLTRTRAWVIESRQKVGLDSGICRPGVLIYRVDAARASGDSPMRALPAGTKTIEPCGPIANATYSVGPGRRSTAHDPRTGLTVKVLKDSSSGSRVRVTLRR